MGRLWFFLMAALVLGVSEAFKGHTSLQYHHLARQARLFNSPVYLERMVERKKIEVDSLLRRHQAADDPLVMRMSYIASECR